MKRVALTIPGAVFVLLIAALPFVGCGPEKGACVRNSGTIFASCGDDFTSANCIGMGFGDSFAEGKTCADLGFQGSIPYGIDDTRAGRIKAAVLQGKGLGVSTEPLFVPETTPGTAPSFVSIPDGPGRHEVALENLFAAAAVGSRVIVRVNGSLREIDVDESPALYESPSRLVPGRGILAKNYTALWRGQLTTLDGIWVFIDEDGSVGELVSIE